MMSVVRDMRRRRWRSYYDRLRNRWRRRRWRRHLNDLCGRCWRGWWRSSNINHFLLFILVSRALAVFILVRLTDLDDLVDLRFLKGALDDDKVVLLFERIAELNDGAFVYETFRHSCLALLARKRGRRHLPNLLKAGGAGARALARGCSEPALTPFAAIAATRLACPALLSSDLDFSVILAVLRLSISVLDFFEIILSVAVPRRRSAAT